MLHFVELRLRLPIVLGLLGCAGCSSAASPVASPEGGSATAAPPVAVAATGAQEEVDQSSDADCEAAARLDEAARAATSPPAPAVSPEPLDGERRAVIEAAINHVDFRRFGARLEGGEEVFVLLSAFVPPDSTFTHFGKRVVVLTERDCMQEMLTVFFEITSLQVNERFATLEYAYPNGAHMGTLLLEKRGSQWQVTDKDARRSSSFRRQRLSAFEARIPRPRLPDEDVTPEDAERCRLGEAPACFRAAVTHHNAGRLEKALDLYRQACAKRHTEACHNGALLLVQKLEGRNEGLCRLEQLCRVQHVALSCRMHDKYSAEPTTSEGSSPARP